MPKNSVKHGTNADVFGDVDGQHVRTESNIAGQPWKSFCCRERKKERKKNKNKCLNFMVSTSGTQLTKILQWNNKKKKFQNETHLHDICIRSSISLFCFIESKYQEKKLEFAHFEPLSNALNKLIKFRYI